MNGLLVDTNLLIVYIVGILDENLIGRHKCTRSKYCKEDWDELRRFICEYQPLVTTPCILAEVSNILPGGFTGEKRNDLFEIFGAIVSEVLDERYTQSKNMVSDSAFSRLGLADIGIELIAKSASPSLHVLTDDLSLYEFLLQRGITTYNFNHLRGLRMGL